MVPYNVKASDIGCDIIEFRIEHMCIRIPKNTILDWSFWKIRTKKIFLLVKVVVLNMLWNIKKMKWEKRCRKTFVQKLIYWLRCLSSFNKKPKTIPYYIYGRIVGYWKHQLGPSIKIEVKSMIFCLSEIRGVVERHNTTVTVFRPLNTKTSLHYEC